MRACVCERVFLTVVSQGKKEGGKAKKEVHQPFRDRNIIFKVVWTHIRRNTKVGEAHNLSSTTTTLKPWTLGGVGAMNSNLSTSHKDEIVDEILNEAAFYFKINS